jgi:hypothetical protein
MEKNCKDNHHYQCTLAWQGVGSRWEGDGLKGESVPSSRIDLVAKTCVPFIVRGILASLGLRTKYWLDHYLGAYLQAKAGGKTQWETPTYWHY